MIFVSSLKITRRWSTKLVTVATPWAMMKETISFQGLTSPRLARGASVTL